MTCMIHTYSTGRCRLQKNWMPFAFAKKSRNLNKIVCSAREDYTLITSSITFLDMCYETVVVFLIVKVSAHILWLLRQRL